MSATTEVLEKSIPLRVRRDPRPSLAIRIQLRLLRNRIDKELVVGLDPNGSPLRRERARRLVGEDCRRQFAATLERLLDEADSSPRRLSSSVPVCRAAIRGSRRQIETIVARLSSPAYISARGVAMISILLTDGTGPLYGTDPANSQVLARALEATIDCLDNGPVLVG